MSHSRQGVHSSQRMLPVSGIWWERVFRAVQEILREILLQVLSEALAARTSALGLN